MAESNSLLRVCTLLNEAGARYLIIGGQACILHGLIRTTEDNLRRVIAGLSKMEDGAAAELTPNDFIENLVVKVADEVEVDVSRRAWKVSFEDAVGTAMEVVIDGVKVPYLGLQKLIESKETYREQDQFDIARLRRLSREQ